MLVDATGRDLIGRLATIVEKVDPILLLLGIGLVALLVVLGLMQKYRLLLMVVLTAAMMSGAKSESVDTAFTIIRWVVIVILALSVVRSRQHPGTPIIMFLMFVVLGISFSVFATQVSFAAQAGVLLLASTMVGITTAMVMTDRTNMRRTMAVYLVPAMVWVVLGLWYLPDFLAGRMQYGYGRFAGFTSASGSYSISGALFLPCLLWGALQRGNPLLRVLFGTTFGFVFVLVLLSTQRSSLYAGSIACLPLLLRTNVKGLAIALCLLAGTGLLAKEVWGSMNKKQTEFIVNRVTDTDDSNRFLLWRASMAEIMREPFLGHGFGSDRALAQGVHLGHRQRPHNWYIVTWYNTGIFGLLLLLATLGVGILRPLRIAISRGADEELKDLARLIAGQLLGICAAGMVDTMGSPSNIQTLTTIVFLVASGRLVSLVDQEQAAQETDEALEWHMATAESGGYVVRA